MWLAVRGVCLRNIEIEYVLSTCRTMQAQKRGEATEERCKKIILGFFLSCTDMRKRSVGENDVEVARPEQRQGDNTIDVSRSRAIEDAGARVVAFAPEANLGSGLVE